MGNDQPAPIKPLWMDETAGASEWLFPAVVTTGQNQFRANLTQPTDGSSLDSGSYEALAGLAMPIQPTSESPIPGPFESSSTQRQIIFSLDLASVLDCADYLVNMRRDETGACRSLAVR